MKGKTLIFLLVVLLLCACNTISSFIGGGDVVARIGRHKLYRNEVEGYVPSGVSREDSIRLAQQFITSWAKDILFLDLAESELSKDEKNVAADLEEYRRSLLRYRYEQMYVNQRLDTAISASQIEAYYNSHLENFRLEEPLVKARLLNISEDSPKLAEITRKMSSENIGDLVAADSIAYSSAMRYTDYGDKWISLSTLALELGTDASGLLSKMKDKFIRVPDGKGNVSIAYISDIMKAGGDGPVEYYADRIRDIILSSRKQKLLSGLEQDLLDKAGRQELLEIY